MFQPLQLPFQQDGQAGAKILIGSWGPHSLFIKVLTVNFTFFIYKIRKQQSSK